MKHRIITISAVGVAVIYVLMWVLFVGDDNDNDMWTMNDVHVREYLNTLEAGDFPYVSENAPHLSADHKKAISIVRAKLGITSNVLYRYRVEDVETGYFVNVIWVYRTEDGHLNIPPPCAGHFGMSISKNWNIVVPDGGEYNTTLP